MFAVTVLFEVDAAKADDFQILMRDNARTSLRVEDGCRQFDVCFNDEMPDRVFLYELYDDRAAFETHLASDHFKQFDAATAAMVISKDVATYTQVIS